jgi:LemA protein
MTIYIVIGAAVLAVTVWFISIYNRLVGLRNAKENAWSQIDVQLKRRHDLIPRLVETVKGYMKHERVVLEEVTKARTAAVSAGGKGPAAAGLAESLLSAALGRLMVLVEGYPDLKADKSFLGLQEELVSTENRVGFARQAYNDAAMHYNTGRETFPANLISGGFARADLFEIDAAAERAVPTIDLGSGQGEG